MRGDQATLIVEHAHKHFGALTAVNNVSFHVERGEIFGIAGPNGSGKSTLFNIISGVPFRDNGGRFLLNGKDVSDTPAHCRFRKGMARTFQTETAFDCLTVAENIQIAQVYGPQRKWSREGIETTLDLVRMPTQSRALPAGEATVFEKKKLMLATAMVSRPILLMLDEPAAGLTRGEIDELRDIIVAINGTGTTIMLVEHVLPLLLSISRRIIVLNQGEEVITGTPHEIINNPRVIEAYLGGSARGIDHAKPA